MISDLSDKELYIFYLCMQYYSNSYYTCDDLFKALHKELMRRNNKWKNTNVANVGITYQKKCFTIIIVKAIWKYVVTA